MITLCDEPTAKFMSESLANHAREIRRYAHTYPEACAALPEAERERLMGAFVENVDRMVNEMYSLMLMARHRGISRYCNHEQIEAYMMDAYSVIEALRAKRADLVPASLN
ncbi:MAG: hypothetical protein LBJ46_03155 [Planctomycetota bacterium]|jgi:hypothetical protein|nr:hypothetical protein [Planctomycetota bacterium]